MTGTPRLQLLLERLARDGALAQSSCSRSFTRAVSPLLSAGILAWEKSGGGKRLAVRNASALLAFVAKIFPPLSDAGLSGSRRVQSAARFRDTKVLRGLEEEIVCVRAMQNGGLLKKGNVIPVAEFTREHGVMSFLLRNESEYALTGVVATVENPTVFMGLEKICPDVPMAIYTRGRLSSRVLRWLKTQAASGLKIIHVGDYDPVGLHEYLRLRKACGEHVSLHVAQDLARLFRDFSCNNLLKRRKSQILLQKLRGCEERCVRDVLALIDETNGGLEQEALLINRACDRDGGWNGG